MVNLQAIQIFLSVAKHGSVFLASKVTGENASHISRQISGLENEWGRKLFARTGRGMVLTDFGQQIYPEAQKLCDYAHQLEDVVRSTASTLAGDVKVGLVPSVSRILLAPLVSDLQESAPGIRIQIVEEFSGSLEKNLASGHCDIAVMNRYSDGRREHEDVIGSVDSMLLGRPTDFDMEGDTITLTQVLLLPLVLAPMPDGLRTFLNYHAALGKR